MSDLLDDINAVRFAIDRCKWHQTHPFYKNNGHTGDTSCHQWTGHLATARYNYPNEYKVDEWYQRHGLKRKWKWA